MRWFPRTAIKHIPQPRRLETTDVLEATDHKSRCPRAVLPLKHFLLLVVAPGIPWFVACHSNLCLCLHMLGFLLFLQGHQWVI